MNLEKNVRIEWLAEEVKNQTVAQRLAALEAEYMQKHQKPLQLVVSIISNSEGVNDEYLKPALDMWALLGNGGNGG